MILFGYEVGFQFMAALIEGQYEQLGPHRPGNFIIIFIIITFYRKKLIYLLCCIVMDVYGLNSVIWND